MPDAVLPQWKPMKVSFSVYSRICLRSRLFVHVRRYCVVDVQQCNGILADNSSDDTRSDVPQISTSQDTGMPLCCQTAVHIAGNKSELRLECRPAFCSQSHIFSASLVSFYPVQQSQFVLSQFRKNLRFHIAFAQFALHIFNNIRDTRVVSMVFIALKQV